MNSLNLWLKYGWAREFVYSRQMPAIRFKLYMKNDHYKLLSQVQKLINEFRITSYGVRIPALADHTEIETEAHF